MKIHNLPFEILVKIFALAEPPEFWEYCDIDDVENTIGNIFRFE